MFDKFISGDHQVSESDLQPAISFEQEDET